MLEDMLPIMSPLCWLHSDALQHITAVWTGKKEIKEQSVVLARLPEDIFLRSFRVQFTVPWTPLTVNSLKNM